MIKNIAFTKRVIFSFLFSFLLITVFATIIVAKDGNEVTFIPMKATAYCLNGITADGSHTRRGIAASKPEWIGLTAAVYMNDNGEPGEFLGYYEIKDTGGKNVKNGKVLDIWLPTEEECKQFGYKKVLVVLVKGVG